MDEIFNQLAGKVILVTGGGGSIGAELCRQILDGEAERKPMALGPFHDPDDPSFVSSFGSATILVRESQAN